MIARRLAAALAAAFALAAAPAGAVQPSTKHARLPESLGLAYESIRFAAAGDSLPIAGWWFAGPEGGPVMVLAPRGRGTMADLLPAVREFQARGFAVLSFDYRDFGPQGAGAQDSLRFVVFASRWVDDMAGALRYARTRAGGARVFAWGQDLGSATAVAAAARDRRLCDALAVEGLFRTSQELLRFNGSSVVPGLPELHQQLVDGADEPLSACARLQVPLFVVLAGKDEVTPPAITQEVARRNPIRMDLWKIPDAGHDGAEKTPGYFDNLARWFKRWVALPSGN